MEPAANDSHLVHQARKGNPQAFTTLVERHFGMVYAVAYAQMGHRETAEDLAQEVFSQGLPLPCQSGKSGALSAMARAHRAQPGQGLASAQRALFAPGDDGSDRRCGDGGCDG